MVTSSTKAKSNKTLFDEVPPLLGFYYPSPQKSLEKSQTKIAIRAAQQDKNVLLTDSEAFATALSDDISSGNFNESWPSTEHDDEFDEPLKEKENTPQQRGERMFSLGNIKKKSSHEYDVSNIEDEEPHSVWDSISLDGEQKQTFTCQISPSEEVLQVQTSADKVLRSARNFISSRNPTRDNSSKNEKFKEVKDVKRNSTADNNCLLNSDDAESYARNEHRLKEKKLLSNPIDHNSERPGERNPDETSVDSSDYLVSSEGLGRWSGTNASSEEMIQPSFVHIQDNKENNILHNYASDLPFSQYWKTNLNEDVLYQWRIKRRIQMAREQAKSDKQGFLPTRVFNQHQIPSKVKMPSEINPAISKKQLPEDISLQVPWYMQTETSKIHMVPDIPISQYEKTVFSQSQTIVDISNPHYQQAGTSSKPFTIPDFQSSLLRPSVSDIPSANYLNNEQAQSLHPHRPLGTENDRFQIDELRISENLSHHQKIVSESQKEKVNAEVQTSPVGHFQISSSHSVPLSNPCCGHDRQHCPCFRRNCDIPSSCKQPSANHPQDHPVSLAVCSDFYQHSSGKTTQYHKYLVAEKPHCSKLEPNIPSSQLEKKGKSDKIPKKKLLKSEKLQNEQKLKGNLRIENKSFCAAETKDNHKSSIKLQQMNGVDSMPPQSYHQSVKESSEESSNDFTDDVKLFLDNSSSSDEEFSSDLMLQHLRKQRSAFKEQLRCIDEKLKILLPLGKN